MKILAIDTSCDDTSAAVLSDDRILSNIINSQTLQHTEWGGVVPSLAKRLHAEQIDTVVAEALQKARVKLEDIDLFAATYGPGLSIALEIGLKKGIELARQMQKPFMPVNHMEGHIYSVFAKNSKGTGQIDKFAFPYLALLVSGKHTDLILMKDNSTYKKLGETLDDAVGEAYDKVARMLKVGYPGGAILSGFSEKGTVARYTLPIPMKNAKELNFSYSGLKSATQRLVTSIEAEHPLSKQDIYDISLAFETAALREILVKTELAITRYPVKTLILGGGVSANIHLRTMLRKMLKPYGVRLIHPTTLNLCTDNAAMIGVAAYWRYAMTPEQVTYDIDRDPSLSLG